MLIFLSGILLTELLLLLWWDSASLEDETFVLLLSCIKDKLFVIDFGVGIDKYFIDGGGKERLGLIFIWFAWGIILI